MFGCDGGRRGVCAFVVSKRNSALQNRITYYTTLAGAKAACLGMQHIEEMRPYDIQSLHALLPT